MLDHVNVKSVKLFSLRGRIRDIQYKQDARLRNILLFALASFPVCILWAMNSGAIQINTLALVWSNDAYTHANLHAAILTEIRFPRIVMTFATGAGLAICGLTLQSLCRNPLADPGLLGVSASAALFAGIGFLILNQSGLSVLPEVLFIPTMAFIGAAVSIALLLLITRNVSIADNLLLVLTGVAINAGAGTLLGLVTFVVDDQTLREITFWSMGSYAGIDWSISLVSSFLICIGCVYLWVKKSVIMLLSLGDSHARFQGLDVKRNKTGLLVVCALITAVCVSFTGIVGFVGLIVPHICRMLVGSHLKLLIPASLLGGGCLVVVADTFARVLIVPAELPIGLLTSGLGVPFFIYLILRTKHKGSHV